MSPDRSALKAVFPEAEHITQAGDCDDCQHESLYFFTLGEELVIREINNKNHVEGGFYCVDCGFGNAGAYPLELVTGA